MSNVDILEDMLLHPAPAGSKLGEKLRRRVPRAFVTAVGAAVLAGSLYSIGQFRNNHPPLMDSRQCSLTSDGLKVIIEPSVECSPASLDNIGMASK